MGCEECGVWGVSSVGCEGEENEGEWRQERWCKQHTCTLYLYEILMFTTPRMCPPRPVEGRVRVAVTVHLVEWEGWVVAPRATLPLDTRYIYIYCVFLI